MSFLIAFVVVTAWVYLTGTLGGFCPMDEGLVLAQTHRLLLGQVPHLDFVSPRPVLSAVIHLLDHLVPLPLFRASRLLALLEIALYTSVLAALVYRRSPRSWTVLHALGFAVALLVNVHGFPMMAWYTIDGILLFAVGFALVRCGAAGVRASQLVAGFVLLGLAPLTKQSFFAAPLAGLALVLGSAALGAARARLRWLVIGAALAGLPGIVYVAAVAIGGGFAAMWTQLLGAAPTWGVTLLAPTAHGPLRDALIGMAALVTAIAACDALARSQRRGRTIAAVLGIALRVAATWAILALPLRLELSWEQTIWGAQTFWMLVVVTLWDGLRTRRIDGVAIALLALGWMTSLSWGYANPNLVAGSMLLAALAATWRAVPVPEGAARPLLRAASVALALIVAGVTMRAFVAARGQPYFDRPLAEATVDLRDVVPALAGIRANPVTAAFVADLTACIRAHPARWVAVLPDNAWVYPGLGLENPMPLDWLYPPEYASKPDVVVRRTQELERRGDYLVVFQPLPAHGICRHDGMLPAATAAFEPRGYGDGLPRQVLRQLRGRTVTCGALLARWQPARAPA